MPVNRRQFLTTSSVLLAGGVLGRLPVPLQPLPVPTPKFQDLRRGVGIFTMQGGTIGWLATPDGIVVIDSQYPATAPVCIEGLTPKSPKGISTLINTHHHADHTGGNKAFRPLVSQIVAHTRVPALQKTAAVATRTEADQVYPDTTFPETWKMTMGNETLSAAYYGPGHTGGDIVVCFEKADVVHMGDLMFQHLHPRIDRPAGASIANWIKALEQVSAAHGAQTLYVFGHGKDNAVTGTKEDLLFFRDYLSAVLDTARKGIQAAQSKEEIVGSEPLPRFADFASLGAALSLAANLAVAYDELTAGK